jgi:hypothetical protein
MSKVRVADILDTSRIAPCQVRDAATSMMTLSVGLWLRRIGNGKRDRTERAVVRECDGQIDEKRGAP